jgi:hypothetical protein
LNDSSLQTIQRGLELCRQQQQQQQQQQVDNTCSGGKEDFILLEMDVKDRIDILKCKNCGSPGKNMTLSLASPTTA